ncbi:Cryptochrome-2 [Merluccius polli]|uniref:Cryptochrome-2 n=1 Tax=Merluccius polli TaxID=89951 RepID=A0AA47MSA8_MERPO|nr:Cryptochrome-2 [Merluccius polli]
MTTVYPSSDGYFQQDNAPCHKARIISDWFLEHDNEFTVLKWPPQSPDLNPIEHLWDVVEREIRIMDVQPTNLQQLRDAIMSIWTKLSEECFQYLVESVPRRIKAVLKAKGGPTRRYLPKLSGYPDQYIHEPWSAPDSVQKEANCVVGLDYPKPMVDHAQKSRLNIERMKQVYQQISSYKGLSKWTVLGITRAVVNRDAIKDSINDLTAIRWQVRKPHLTLVARGRSAGVCFNSPRGSRVLLYDGHLRGSEQLTRNYRGTCCFVGIQKDYDRRHGNDSGNPTSEEEELFQCGRGKHRELDAPQSPVLRKL